MVKKFLLFIFFFGTGLATVHADDEQFERELDYINERYKSFFEQDKVNQQIDEERMSGVPEVKQEGGQYQRDLERTRLEHIRERKPREDDTQLEALHEAELKRLERQKELERQEYVREREALNRVLQGARKIPENRDAGLED